LCGKFYEKLLTGEKYSFSESYDVSFDVETTTVTIYVWRDAPYETERKNVVQKEREHQND